MSQVNEQAFVLVTGMSGAGRSTAAKALEDLGWFVIDNLPPGMLFSLAEEAGRVKLAADKVAAVVDVRSLAFTSDLNAAIEELDGRGVGVRVLFLEAGDKGWSAGSRMCAALTRSRPTDVWSTASNGSAASCEKSGQRGPGDRLLHPQRERVSQEDRLLFRRRAAPGLMISVVSFGYKNGLPVDADLVVDCRFLPNPHWVPNFVQ